MHDHTNVKGFIQRLALLVSTGALVAAPMFGAHLIPYQGSFELSGDQEVPAVDTPYTGNCVAILDGTSLSLSCTSDVPMVTGAHVHAGFPGENGPVLAPLNAGRVIVQTVELTAEQAAMVEVGGAYVNLHTQDNPGGEIRGQIRLNQVEDTEDLMLRGGADSEVPPAASDATADCRVISDRDDTPTMRVVCVHTVENPTAAHVHAGPPGENGPVVFAFDDPTSPIIQSFDLDPAQLQDLEDKTYYVNIHSDAFPGGEARVDFRGCSANNNTLCLNDSRFEVTLDAVDPNTNKDIRGVARSLSADSGTFSLFTAGNKEALVKVLDACAINLQYWVFAAATTTVEYALTVTDTHTGEVSIYTNEAGNPAEPVTDTSAFLCDAE